MIYILLIEKEMFYYIFINYRQEDSHLYRWEMNCKTQFFCGYRYKNAV